MRIPAKILIKIGNGIILPRTFQEILRNPSWNRLYTLMLFYEVFFWICQISCRQKSSKHFTKNPWKKKHLLNNSSKKRRFFQDLGSKFPRITCIFPFICNSRIFYFSWTSRMDGNSILAYSMVRNSGAVQFVSAQNPRNLPWLPPWTPEVIFSGILS